MNYKIITSIFFIFLSQAYVEVEAQIENKEQILSLADKLNKKLFDDKINILTQPVTPDQFAEWDKFSKKLSDYVQAYGPDFMKFYTTIDTAAHDSTNTIKLVYDSYIAPTFKDSARKEQGVTHLSLETLDVNRLNIVALDTQLESLRKVANVLARVQDDFRSLILTSPQEKEVRQVLSIVTTYLQLGIDNVFRDAELLEEFLRSQHMPHPQEILIDEAFFKEEL